MRSLRRYDVQAKVALLISVLSALSLAALGVILLRNYQPDLRAIQFGTRSLYGPIVFGTTAVTMLLSFTGVVMGFNSAGQRRNEMQARSWIAFFLGIAVLSGSIIAFFIFWYWQLKIAQ